MSHSFQECTECGKEKPYKEFYRIYGGYRIKKCKICYTLMRREEQREKAKRKKAAKLW
tara:strand:+ start:338 stop:511 length:174 start_codon:yes stop_codon:yes gene_type:complete